MTYTPSTMPNSRIDVADILRGIAIGGIVLIHFLEHMNFYLFPDLTAVDRAVWETVFFLLAGKMYAIFALLFGLSLYIQHDNHAQRGEDFRLRFVWRMILLMLLGLVDLCFYNGDILTVYALCGVLVLPLVRLSTRWLVAIAALLALQPIEMIYLLLALVCPELKPLDLGSGLHYAAMLPAQVDGSMWEVARVGIVHGLPCNFLWAVEHGRMTQTLLLFVVGLLLGRWRMFYDEGKSVERWKSVAKWGAVLAFLVFDPVLEYVVDAIDNQTIAHSLGVIATMWRNLSMTALYVALVVLAFYRTRWGRRLMVIAPYGRMSLTNYLGQSIIGGMLFYGWGFGLYSVSGHTMSLFIGMAVVFMQWLFCRWWLKRHRRGPFEELWHRLTYL